MAFGRRRFTRAVVVRPPLDFTAAGGDATVTLLGAASVTLPFNPLDVPAADLDAIDDELAALLTTLVLA